MEFRAKNQSRNLSLQLNVSLTISTVLSGNGLYNDIYKQTRMPNMIKVKFIEDVDTCRNSSYMLDDKADTPSHTTMFGDLNIPDSMWKNMKVFQILQPFDWSYSGAKWGGFTNNRRINIQQHPTALAFAWDLNSSIRGEMNDIIKHCIQTIFPYLWNTDIRHWTVHRIWSVNCEINLMY